MPPERIWILLGKKKSGEATEEELAELESLLSYSGDDGFAHEVVDKLWASNLATVPEMQMDKDRWSHIAGYIQKSRKPFPGKVILLLRKTWAVAASLVIIFGVYWFVIRGSDKKTNPIATQIAGTNNISTQPGSKSKIELPDGTQVWLNANSHLTYGSENFGSVNREVTLSGEAFFDVVKNEKVPFIIHTQTITITVKGTAFNVKAYPDEKTIETSLVRGLIEITTRKDPDRKILLKPNEKIIIPVDGVEKGQPAKTDASIYSITPLQRIKNSVLPETVWMQPRLEFDNETLEDLAPKMENWFNIRIHFMDDEIKSKRFSGVIEKETLNQTLEDLQLSYHFHYQVKENQLWLGKK